jgi:N-acetylglucosamine kinase-like BadF-type ATPase
MSQLYLGMDGGQSSTRALIATDSGRVIGSGRSGPCNHVRTSEGRAKFIHAVSGCIEEACGEAGIDASTVMFAAVCLGFSGGPEDKEAYSRELIRSGKYKITHDAEIALSGATAGRPGIIVIAGTGSMVFGRNAAGQTARAGGWGYIFGDEGGGFDLTRRALRAALQYEEGWHGPTALRGLLLESTGARDANDLLHRFYTAEYTRTKIAGLAPLVTRAAEEGDEVARDILNAAAGELVSFARGVYQQLFQADEDVAIAHVGGVFQSAPLLACFKERVRALISCEVCAPRFDPAAGAVLEALRLNGNQSELSNVPKSEK